MTKTNTKYTKSFVKLQGKVTNFKYMTARIKKKIERRK